MDARFLALIRGLGGTPLTDATVFDLEQGVTKLTRFSRPTHAYAVQPNRGLVTKKLLRFTPRGTRPAPPVESVTTDQRLIDLFFGSYQETGEFQAGFRAVVPNIKFFSTIVPWRLPDQASPRLVARPDGTELEIGDGDYILASQQEPEVKFHVPRESAWFWLSRDAARLPNHAERAPSSGGHGATL